MDPASAPRPPSAFQQELVSIRHDPKVIVLALRWAGRRDLADDALQTAYYRVASVPHPERIVNLRAYFRRVLRNEVTGLYAVSPPLPLAEAHSLGPVQPIGSGPEPAVDDQACRSVLLKLWLTRYAGRRGQLAATLPCRSADLARYREVIHTAGKQVLLGQLSLEAGDPAFPKVLRVAYPAYFADPAAPPNTLHQRISRARDDIKALLRTIVNRDELS